MKTGRRRKAVLLALLLSETSHVFCCVLPTVFSIAGLLSGIGMIGAMPAGWVRLHDFMHERELPVIAFSGAVLAFGWALDIHGRRVDCHDTGCCHPPCKPKKSRAHKLLIAATVLFAVNVVVYLVFHRGLGF